MEMCFVRLILVHRCPATTLSVVLETVAPGDQAAKPISRQHPSILSDLKSNDFHKCEDAKALLPVCGCVCVRADRCEQCEYEAQLYVDGQKFSSRAEPCLHCRCSVSSGWRTRSQSAGWCSSGWIPLCCVNLFGSKTETRCYNLCVPVRQVRCRVSVWTLCVPPHAAAIQPRERESVVLPATVNTCKMYSFVVSLSPVVSLSYNI